MCGACAREFWAAALRANRERASSLPDPPTLAEQSAMVEEIYHAFHWQAEQHAARARNPETKQAQRCARAAEKHAARRAAVEAKVKAGWSREQIKQTLRLHPDTMQRVWPVSRRQPTDMEIATVRDLMASGLKAHEIRTRTGISERRIRAVRLRLRQALQEAA